MPVTGYTIEATGTLNVGGIDNLGLFGPVGGSLDGDQYALSTSFNPATMTNDSALGFTFFGTGSSVTESVAVNGSSPVSLTGGSVQIVQEIGGNTIGDQTTVQENVVGPSRSSDK